MDKSVYFRAFEEEDALLIHQWKNDDEINHLTLGLNKRTCLAEDLEWVKDRMKHNPFSAYWAVCSCENDEMIGWIGLSKIHFINSSAEAGGIVIGNRAYRDGFAWIEAELFMFEYVFERLGLNRFYGESLLGHKTSNFVENLMFMTREGVFRQAAFKNGRFYDISYAAILKEEYFAHKEAGDYEMSAVIRRLKQLRKEMK